MKKFCALAIVVGLSALAATSGQAAGSHKPATSGKQGHVAPSSKNAAGSGYYGKTVQPHPQPGTGNQYKPQQAGMPKAFGPNGSKFNGKSLPYGKTFMATNGKSYTYQPCPQYLQSCCKPCSYCGWTHYCSFPSWNCCGCWCPVAHCWYYWYEPYCCYLPCSCMNQCPPVQCGDPGTQPPPDDGTGYGDTGLDYGSTTDSAPPLPQGATKLKLPQS
jgi:hypothetical protein